MTATKPSGGSRAGRHVRRSAIGAATGVALATCLLAPAAAEAQGGPAEDRPLDLGPTNLTETRVVSTLARGVTLTKISRGASDPALVWTLEVLIGPAAGSPDPDAPPHRDR